MVIVLVLTYQVFYMKYSQLFVKTQKELPSQEDSRNAELLIRAGFIRKEMAGVYSFLPLGLRVLRKIEGIVREEMDRIGAQEVLMSELAPKENWEKTGRWDSVDVLYKLEVAKDKRVALSPSHEEIVTPLVQNFIRSYKDFPVCVYQIQTKFRNEPRAKSGLLRGREFLMKDAYSFHTSQEDFEAYYEIQKQAYFKVYDRLGIGDRTVVVAASGGDFSQLVSHEFQTFSEVGEDEIFINKKTGEAFNKEIVSEKDQQSGKYEVKKAVEVGNIFPLATKYTEAFDYQFVDNDGKEKLIIMGCYGIGISRLMGVLAEIFSDEKGLRWPPSVAPFDIYLAAIGKDDLSYLKAEALYEALQIDGRSVFYDDRRDKKIGPGQKFADHELMGIPVRIVVSERGLQNDEVELVDREQGVVERVALDEVVGRVREQRTVSS